MSLKTRLVPVVLLCGVQGVAAQETRTPRDAPVVIRGARVGRPVPAVSIDIDLRDLPAPPEWQPGDPIKEIPRRAYPRRPVRPSRLPAGPDPLLALQPDPPAPAPQDFDVPVANFDAQTFTGVNPPDTVGDVGPAHYIHATNQGGGTTIRIYDKTLPNPALLATFALDSLAPAGDCASGLGDPVVLYDELAGRWLLSEFSDAGNRMCVYVSQTGDPVSGGWWFYQFTGSSFPDYPKYGVWPDAYYVSTNESDAGAYAFDRANMLNGATARPAQRFSAPADLVFPFQALTPADHDGALAPPAGAPGIFMRHKDDEATPPATGSDFLQVWEMHVDWTTPANSTFTGPINIAVSDFSSELCGFSSFSCFPQPGSSIRLDPLREVIMFRLAYRRFPTHQALVGNLVTDADGEPDTPANNERGGIRWFELRKTSGPWTLFQEGTHSPDTNARWMAGIAMDSSGNIGLGYNVSGASLFPSLRYAGRLATDAFGRLRAETPLVAGAAPNGSNRYGDYSSMSVDPADGCTFWFSGMYNPAAQWRTRVGAFRFDACGGPPGNVGTFDPTYEAPACLSAGRSCDSETLLTGRDGIPGGPEPNQPNTIGDSCPDGTAGTFHGRESIDRIVVRSFDGQELAAGKQAQVDVTVWGWSTGFGDVLELYRAADAGNPTWVKFATFRPTGRGLQVLTGGYTLPAGSVQAVRARFRYRGSEGPCGSGPYDDHDDIVFAVQ